MEHCCGRLLTADIVCFGTPSPAAFQSYLLMLENRAKKRVTYYAHRGSGIAERGPEFAVYQDGSIEKETAATLSWSRTWYDFLIRESCYRCGWHSINRPGDITLGDYWGIDGVCTGLKDEWGVSLVMANAQAGLSLIQEISAQIELLATSVAEAANPEQPMLRHPPKRGDRTEFWRALYTGGFDAAGRSAGAISLLNSLRSLARRSGSLLKSEGSKALNDDVNKGWSKMNPVDFDAIRERGKYPVAFAAKNCDDEVRRMSSSGGIFHALASHIINDLGGVVFGCAFDEDLRAAHVRCETVAEAGRCMGSKYSQSDMGDAIQLVRDDLAAGRTVLFTGTPCQVAAVRAACGNASDR